MRRLIVNADDFGLSTGVNQGIVEAHVRGVLTSTSLMVDRDAATEAAALAEQHPALSVGLHFVEDGPGIDDPAHVAREFARQLGRFRELMGAEPTHVDSHHHVHVRRLSTFAPLVAPLGVPLRGDGRVPYVGAFFAHPEPGVVDHDRIREPFLLRLLGEIPADAGFTELGCHPGLVTDELSSSYTHEREIELGVLTAPDLPARIDGLGLVLANYRDWRP
ncbi:MAG: ChbG/HpnK family deacetylase [Solirubrobacterales bacterium]|nr:ChbG/HpnK family deacetylase [Solirubrobacterales bacterium]